MPALLHCSHPSHKPFRPFLFYCHRRHNVWSCPGLVDTEPPDQTSLLPEFSRQMRENRHLRLEYEIPT